MRQGAESADKSTRQRARGIFILVFGVALAGLGLIAPWGLIGSSLVTGVDVSNAVDSNAATSASTSGLTRIYIGDLMLYLPFVVAAVALGMAAVRSPVPALRWTLALLCVGIALVHALCVRDAFAGTAGYGSWMVGAGYLVLGYGSVVVARAAAAMAMATQHGPNQDGPNQDGPNQDGPNQDGPPE